MSRVEAKRAGDLLRTAYEETFNKEPKPDIAICSKCGWRGPVSECDVDPYGDGDWESGYVPVDLCPVCEDGGCIDDYDMSDERFEEWRKWWEENEKRNIKYKPHS